MISQIFQTKSKVKLGFYGPPNAGKCVTPDTEIILYNGEIRPIENVFLEALDKKSQLNTKYHDIKEHYIDVSDMNIQIPSFDPSTLKITPKNVAFVYRQKYDGEVYKITTKSGRSVRATPNHPLIRISDNGVEKVRSADLRLGDSVAIARNMNLKSDVRIPLVEEPHFNVSGRTIQVLSKYHNPKSISAVDCINEDLIRFVGYVLTESNHTSKRIKFSNTDEAMLKDFETITEKLFNLETIKRINKGVAEREINSKTLVEYLKSTLGFKPALSGNKEIPSKLMGLDNAQSAVLLRTLFDTEGSLPNSASKRGACIEYPSKSRRLVEQVQILLNRFGIVGKFNKRIIDGQEYWRLLISGSDNHRKFRDNIGFSLPYKSSRLDNLCKAGLKRNNFTLPIMNLLEKTRQNLGMEQQEFYLDDKHVSRMRRDNRITYHRIENMAKHVNDAFIKSVAEADTLWDPITSIERETYEGYVYDLTVNDTHTFVLSNGLIAHNTTLANRISKDWLGEEMGSVSKIPHETRNVNVKESVQIKHKGREMGFTLIDTPGIATKIDYEEFMKFKMKEGEAKKRAKEATEGVIEAIKWLDDVDCVCVVLDATENPYSQVNITIIGNLAARNIPVLIVGNKVDLKKANLKKIEAAFPQYEVVGISAMKGKNMEEFYESLFRMIKKR